MVHTPDPVNVTTAPVWTHTVAEEGSTDKVSGKPAEVVAAGVYEPTLSWAAVGAADVNVIVCVPLLIAKESETCAAAL
jgi:hypothetical protein